MNEIIVLAGQSNIIGGSNTGSTTCANASRIYRKAQPSTYFNNGTVFEPIDVANPGSGSWDLATDANIHSWPGHGTGPGMAIGDRWLTLRNNSALDVGLVGCGWSSSRMNGEWSRMLHYGSAFGMMIARAQAAKAWGTIKGLVWYQGEQEASNQFQFSPDIYPNWNIGLLDLICKFRQLVADVPVVVVQLGPNPNRADFPNWANMQQQQGTIAGVLPNVSLVTTSDLTTIPDGVHLDCPSQPTLGRRIAESLFAMS